MMAAQRYPDDYDGIVAGAPVYSWADEMTQQAWTVHALTETPRSALTVNQMQALQDAATARCAGPHGLVADPRRCAFDPAELQCPRAGGECLAPEQVAAVRRIYAGPATSNGKQITPGFPRGGERGWEQFYASVSADGSMGGGSWLGVYRYMVFDDPHWTLDRMNFDRDPLYARQRLGPMLDADNPDLDRFAGHGGKLLAFHGWADQQVPAQSSLAYRDAVVARSTLDRVDQYFRLFMVPGMAHCLPESVAPSSPSPTGPNLVLLPDQAPGSTASPQNDALAALQAWVEQGIAPAQFVVRVRNDAAGVAVRTVLACAEPSVPVWRGAGDPLDATQWVCRQQ
jgi:feruloyl esterase